MVVLNQDQHFSVLREITRATEEFTPSNPMQGKWMALVGQPRDGDSAPRLVVLTDEVPERDGLVPRVNFNKVVDHQEFCEGMPEAAEMVLDKDDTDGRREWEVPRKVWIPTRWVDHFTDHPTFEAAISRIDKLLLRENRDTIDEVRPFCIMVATACCAEVKGHDTSILTTNATPLKHTARVSVGWRRSKFDRFRREI